MQYRKRLEEVALRDFLFARKAYDDAAAVLNQYYQSISDTRELSGLRQSAGGQTAEQLCQMNDFIAGQLIRIERQKEVIRQLAAEMEQRHQSLTKAAQDFKILEKLKERLQSRFKQKEKRKELKEVDDMIVMKFSTRSRDV